MRATQGQYIYLKDYKKPAYRTLEVDLDFRLDPTETRIISKMKVRREKGTAKSKPLAFDGDGLNLVSVRINGKPLPQVTYEASATALILKGLPKRDTFEVEIETQVNPTTNTALMGLYRSGGSYCTQCEAEGFRRMTYFQDRPDVLAVYTTRIEASRKEAPVLLGNGNPVKRGSAGKGRHFAIWHDPHPKPSYLFALVAGDLGSLHKPFKTTSGRKVKLGIYVKKGNEAKAEYAMDALIRSMRWDEDVFGCEYDLDVFNIVAIPDFNMGAMENKGLNIFNDKFVLADPQSATDTDYDNIERIIAHEYFHNWTGNRITCRDWFQLCLKEGLTVFRDQEFSSDMRSRAVKRIADVRLLKTHQFPEDAGPLAHAVRPEKCREINNFYTSTVYEKGAELVRMLAAICGPEKFMKGMALYLKRHDGEAATVEQFLACFRKAARIDLDQFALWYSQAGTPVIGATAQYDRAGKRLVLELEQATRPTPGQRRKAPVHIPQDIALFSKSGNRINPTAIRGVEQANDLLHLTKRRHRITFDGVGERPVISLNRNFTAPVETDFRQTNADLMFLAKHEEDLFSRWQAIQVYAMRLIVRDMRSIRSGGKQETDAGFLEVIRNAVADETLEPAFRAILLTLPGEGDVAQFLGRNVDPTAIHEARSALACSIGREVAGLRDDLASQLKTPGTFDPGAEAAGKRALKNVLLSLAVQASSKAAIADAEKQFRTANNMTDRFAALQAISHHHPVRARRGEVLRAFHEKHRPNHLILDKWFAVQAMQPGDSSVEAVRKLMKHRDFTFNNPNRLRSLIGVFSTNNPAGFNRSDGAGYELVADAVTRLDKINPQVAARLLTAFRSWRSLEPGRRKLACSVLQDLQRENGLSRDVSDILERTLEDS